jgi:hypothetical protein
MMIGVVVATYLILKIFEKLMGKYILLAIEKRK